MGRHEDLRFHDAVTADLEEFHVRGVLGKPVVAHERDGVLRNAPLRRICVVARSVPVADAFDVAVKDLGALLSDVVHDCACGCVAHVEAGAFRVEGNGGNVTDVLDNHLDRETVVARFGGEVYDSASGRDLLEHPQFELVLVTALVHGIVDTLLYFGKLFRVVFLVRFHQLRMIRGLRSRGDDGVNVLVVFVEGFVDALRTAEVANDILVPLVA